MPTYEYVCSKCKKRFEVWQRITDKPVNRCARKGCRGRVSRTIAGGGGVIFKGSGFYVTDYKKPASNRKEAADAGPKPEQARKEPGKGAA